MNLSTNRNRLTDMQNRLVVAKAYGGGSGMDCEFGVGRCITFRMDKKIRSYHRAQGTIFSLLRENMMEDSIRKRMYVCVCVKERQTVPYSRNWHNTVNQLYFKK